MIFRRRAERRLCARIHRGIPCFLIEFRHPQDPARPAYLSTIADIVNVRICRIGACCPARLACPAGGSVVGLVFQVHPVAVQARPVGVAGLCHGVCMDEGGLWDAYDRMGPSFRQHAADSAYNAHYDRPAVLAALGPVTGRRVLDAACGPGLYLRELLERGAEVTGFDASPVMVTLARQQTAGRVRIDQAVLGKPLPYPDDAFDLIVCALAIHYASDRAAAFAEFCRVLRPGGAAVVSTQHPVMDWLRKGGSYFQTTLETDIWHTPSGDQPVHFWREPLSALCTAATDAGFLIEKVIEPVPAETMRERYPEDYEKLSNEPGFLILRLLKPARQASSPPR
jgi:SAM-dependent methyltransferase